LTATTPALPPETSNDLVATTPDGSTGTFVKGWVSSTRGQMAVFIVKTFGLQ
jgi:hypothetical protein